MGAGPSQADIAQGATLTGTDLNDVIGFQLAPKERSDRGEGKIDPQFILRERDTGRPPRRARGQGAQVGCGGSTDKGLRIRSQVGFGRERQTGNLFIAQPPWIEAEALEEATVVGG